jgi:Tfp pilus assembly protein PilF
MAIAGLALTMKNIPAAVNGFNKAVNMDPQLVQAWVMLARIHAAVGQFDEMKKTLEKAIAANPGVPEFKQMLNDAK